MEMYENGRNGGGELWGWVRRRSNEVGTVVEWETGNRSVNTEVRRLKYRAAEQNRASYSIDTGKSRLGLLSGCLAERSNVYLAEVAWSISRIMDQIQPQSN